MKKGPVLLMLLAAAFAGCRKKSEPPAVAPVRPALTPVSPPSASAKRYPLKGVVVTVAASRPQIVVRHEEIPGFMAAMTMPFPVRDDPKVVGLLRPGDRIEATLVVDGDSYFLEEILTKGFVPTPSPGPGAAIRPQPNQGVAVGDTVPDFTLTDQTGRAVRLSQFRGEPVAVTFVYTRCPIATACPMTMTKFAKLNAAIGSKKVGRLLAVTVDPEGDTVPVLKEFAEKIGADPSRWKFLTGEPAAVARVAETFGVLYYPDRGQIVHSQAVAVVGPDGKLETIYFGEEWEPEAVLQDLQKARKG